MLWSILLVIAILVVVVMLLFVALVKLSLKKGHENMNKGVPEFDMTGKVYRNYLKLHYLPLKHSHTHFLSILGYDPEDNHSLKEFEEVKNKTECKFAKNSKLWGSPTYLPTLSLRRNVENALQSFSLFLKVGKGRHLDGYVMHVESKHAHHSVHEFGRLVFTVLKCLSDHDPHHVHCIDKSYLPSYGWWFEFDNEFIFVTTFASCYKSDHSRHTFGANPDSCFILFQPEYSFAFRNISCGEEPTEWENPKTVRDQIRVSYKQNGRNYILDSNSLGPTAHQIVRPLNLQDPVVKWWEEK